jgi:hypothetical protein
VLAEPADGPLDGVALLVCRSVEGRRASAVAAALVPVAGLVGGFGDGGLDAAPACLLLDAVFAGRRNG